MFIVMVYPPKTVLTVSLRAAPLTSQIAVVTAKSD